MDKLLHITLSFALVFAFHSLFFLKGAVTLAGLIGALKESVWDYAMHMGCPDGADMVANVIGLALATLLIIKWGKVRYV